MWYPHEMSYCLHTCYNKSIPQLYGQRLILTNINPGQNPPANTMAASFKEEKMGRSVLSRLDSEGGRGLLLWLAPPSSMTTSTACQWGCDISSWRTCRRSPELCRCTHMFMLEEGHDCVARRPKATRSSRKPHKVSLSMRWKKLCLEAWYNM